MKYERTTKTLWFVGAFSIAMGFLEAAVVVYLRLHFYPGGFVFPLAPMPGMVLIVEIAREVATIVMLVCIGWLAGGSALGRFAYFAFAFAVWDILYYVFLKLTLGWPESLLTSDILLLIPVPWIAPVLAPVLCSVALIFAAVVVLRREEEGRPLAIGRWHWAGIFAGGVLMLASFMADTGAALHQSMPGPFPWWIFGAGLCVSVAAFVAAWSGLGSRG